MSRKRFFVLVILVLLILLAASGVVASLAELQEQLTDISRPSVGHPAPASPTPRSLSASVSRAAPALTDHGLVLVLVILGGVILSVATVAWGFWHKRRRE